MNVFAELVEARADRLLDAPFERLPDAKLFAVDTELEPPDDWHPTDGAPANRAHGTTGTDGGL